MRVNTEGVGARQERRETNLDVHRELPGEGNAKYRERTYEADIAADEVGHTDDSRP